MSRSTSIIVTVFLLMWTSYSFATGYGKGSLRGMDGVAVKVNVDSELSDIGLYKDKLQTDIELKLRKYNIKILTEDETNTDSGNPVLYVNLYYHKAYYSYYIEVNLYQYVKLVRDDTIAYASTYQVNGSGWLGCISYKNPYDGKLYKGSPIEAAKIIRGAIGDAVDIFINDYLAANPK
jgi:hypothetical protein